MSINADEVKKICAIYDWDAKGEIDMYYFMDIFYALGMNIIKKTTVKFGQTDDFGKKFCKYDEVVKLMQEAVKEPDSTGNYHDYVELCKLYDKNENGTILLAELENILSNLGKSRKEIRKSRNLYYFLLSNNSVRKSSNVHSSLFTFFDAIIVLTDSDMYLGDDMKLKAGLNYNLIAIFPFKWILIPP